MIQEAHKYLTSKDGEKTLQKLRSQVDPATASNKDAASVKWLVMNDGSKDNTCQVVREAYAKTHETRSGNSHLWKIVSLKQNSGKGAAVKMGMQLAQGHFLLMVDAGGAPEFGKGLEKLTDTMVTSSDETQQSSLTTLAAFGSRAHLQNEVSAQRPFVRTLLMKGFHFFVSLFVSTKIQETQCGFKLFPRDASRLIFGTLHLRRWAFDTEIVLLCEQISIPILEVGVPWHDTSKLALAIVLLTMLYDLCAGLLHLWNMAGPQVTIQ